MLEHVLSPPPLLPRPPALLRRYCSGTTSISINGQNPLDVLRRRTRRFPAFPRAFAGGFLSIIAREPLIAVCASDNRGNIHDGIEMCVLAAESRSSV